MAIIKNPIKKDIVVRVYSGKSGCCMCGCKGKYYYPSNLDKTAAAKARGYEIDDDEINDGQVTRVLNIVNKNLDSVEVDIGDYASVNVDGRDYFLFFKY